MRADEWDERYRTGVGWRGAPNRAFADSVADLPPGRALDLACGEGRNAVWLAEHGWDVTAVDFSAVALGLARSMADERGVVVQWLQADVVAYQPPAGAYDLVAVIFLHLPGPERRTVLRRAADAVAPGGTLLVVGHDARNLAEGHGGPGDPAVLYTPQAVAAEVGDLQVVRAETIRRAVDEPEGAVALDTVVVGRRGA